MVTDLTRPVECENRIGRKESFCTRLKVLHKILNCQQFILPWTWTAGFGSASLIQAKIFLLLYQEAFLFLRIFVCFGKIWEIFAKGNEGTWTDFDGTALSYNNWYGNAPKNSLEDYVHLGRSGNWNDVPYNRARTHIVCAKPAPLEKGNFLTKKNGKLVLFYSAKLFSDCNQLQCTRRKSCHFC